MFAILNADPLYIAIKSKFYEIAQIILENDKYDFENISIFNKYFQMKFHDFYIDISIEFFLKYFNHILILKCFIMF